MVYQTSCLWYFDPPIHGISNLLPMVYWTPYSGYIKPSTQGISNPLPIAYRTPTHGVSNPLHTSYWTPSDGIMNHHFCVQNTILYIYWTRGQNTILYIEPGVKIPYGILNQGIFQGFKKPYDTRSTERYILHIQVPLECCNSCHMLKTQATSSYKFSEHLGDCCGRDRMVVRFTTTCAISAYHH